MAKNWFAKKHAKKEYDVLYHEERAVVEATEAILHLLEKTKRSKADLAKALGKSKAHVTQALSGERNMTIRTFASFAWACGYTLDGFELRPIDTAQTSEVLGHAVRQRWIEQVAKEVAHLAPPVLGPEVAGQDLALAA